MENSNYEYEHPLTAKDKETIQQDFNNIQPEVKRIMKEKEIPLYERGHKVHLDPEQTKESDLNRFFDCRDGVITMTEYYDGSGYGSLTRLYLCHDTKHESVCIVRQTKLAKDTWNEETMYFDSDSFANFLHLLGNKENPYNAEIKLLRDY